MKLTDRDAHHRAGLPHPVHVIDQLDAHFADEPLPIEAPLEHVLEGVDGELQRYARRRLDQVLGRPRGVEAGPPAHPRDTARAAVDDWISRFLLEWRRQFGPADVRPAR